MFLDSIDKYMVQVAKNVFNNRSLAYQYLYQHWEDGSDPRTSSFYFVKFSNMGMITFMLMYVLSVWYLIPTFMRKRPAYNLKNAILFYDFFMVILFSCCFLYCYITHFYFVLTITKLYIVCILFLLTKIALIKCSFGFIVKSIGIWID